MTESIKDLENRWHLLMAATNPKTGQRVYETNLQYQRECHALRTQIESLKAAEAVAASRAQISPAQIAQLEYLDRLQGARDKDGKRVWSDLSPKGQQFRANVDQARQKIYLGGTLSDAQLAATQAVVEAQGATVPEPVAPRVLTARERQIAAESSAGPGTNMPPPHHYVPLAQPTSGVK